MQNAKAKLEALQKKRETEAILATLSVPQFHSSFKTATELLCDPRRNGEVDARRQLRERFAFHREKQRPTAAPLALLSPYTTSSSAAPAHQQAHPASAPVGASHPHRVPPSSSLSLKKMSATLTSKPKFLEPILAPKQQQQRSASPPVQVSLNTTLTSRPSLLASSHSYTSHQQVNPALAEYASLAAIHEAFAPRWKHLVEKEKTHRIDIQRDHSIVLESMLKDLSRTIDIETMVRPEVAASLGLTVNVKLPNYLEEEHKRFMRAHDRLISTEELHRGEVAEVLLREFAALRRSSVRRLRALQQEYDARIAAAASEVAMQVQLLKEQRLASIADQMSRTVDEEVTERFVQVDLAEFAARHELDFRLNALWRTIIRVARKQQFDAMIVSHHALSSDERQGREVIEAEERAIATTALRDQSLELDRVCLVYAIGQRMGKVVELEGRLRGPREDRLLVSHTTGIVENGADLLIESYSALLRAAWDEVAWVWAQTTFVAFCEEEQRTVLSDARDSWCGALSAQIAGSHGGLNVFVVSVQSIGTGAGGVGGNSRFFTNTPTSDVMDPPANRSALSSRQLSSRRPLWSAGGNSGRTSRVPTPDASAARPVAVLRSRQSSDKEIVACIHHARPPL
ncbi:Hypothetical protein, putative [Bodo saltans]|uniref:Uncharacterized protein n=1 Tax=Bodo saltans TaxID=75058 RepID=A0A0S4J0I3_BODSA|nr:Hypothetical protein, putative [Bodo saltans]|eukprot:CUG32370.1 Hypothetical protein, putative [Bodo saltans]